MNEFLEWLKTNKINANGKYRDRRWGIIHECENGGWRIRINVQYDEYLAPFLSNESPEFRELISTHSGFNGCGRCIDGKCAVTGFELYNPTKEQIELAKRMIMFRVNAIREGRIPRCSYIKLSRRGEKIEPCAVHKVCDPRCKAMKKC